LTFTIRSLFHPACWMTRVGPALQRLHLFLISLPLQIPRGTLGDLVPLKITKGNGVTATTSQSLSGLKFQIT